MGRLVAETSERQSSVVIGFSGWGASFFTFCREFFYDCRSNPSVFLFASLKASPILDTIPKATTRRRTRAS